MVENKDEEKTYRGGPSPSEKSPPPLKKQNRPVSRPGNVKKGIGLKWKLPAYLILATSLITGGVIISDYAKSAYDSISKAVFSATHTNPAEARLDFQESLGDYKKELNVYDQAVTGIVKDAAQQATPAQLELMTTTTYQKMSDQQKTEFVSTAATDVGMVCKEK